MESITIKKEYLFVVCVLLLITILISISLVMKNKYEANIIKATNEGKNVGYQTALYDIAYAVATRGEAVYLVPTTNITLTLIRK